MKKTKSNIIFSILAAFTLLFTFSGNLFALNSKLDIKFNKIAYSQSDPVEINVNLLPIKDTTDVRISLKIGEKDNYVFSKTTYLGDIKAGEKQIVNFSNTHAKNFGFEAGKNPILIEVSSKQNIINKYEALIGIQDNDEHPKLNVAMAIKVTPKPYLDTEKNITSSELNNKTFSDLGKYYQIALKHNGFLNFIFSPMLAESINIMAAGYTLNENSNPIAVPAESQTSKKASSVLASYKQLFKTNNAHLILTSYSNINTKQFETESFNDQFSHGKAILDDIFSSAYPALYTNKSKLYLGQNFGKNNLWLSVNGAKKTQHIVTTESLVGTKSKQSSLMSTFATLADAQNKNKDDIVIITDSMVQANYITDFIALAKKESWLSLKPLSFLKTSITKGKLNKISKQSKSLTEIRNKYYLLQNALASENEEFNKAQMAIYLAEDSYYKNTNTKFINIANQKLSAELAKIQIKVTPIALTGNSGKLPVKIINNTNSQLKVSLKLKAKGLKIINPKKILEINPKENLVNIPINVLESGDIKVEVNLLSNNTLIDSDTVIVSTSLPITFWMYAIVFIFVFLFLIIGAFYARDRRSKVNSAK